MSWPTTRRHPRTMAEAFPRDHACAVTRYAGSRRIVDALLDWAAAIGAGSAAAIFIVRHL